MTVGSTHTATSFDLLLRKSIYVPTLLLLSMASALVWQFHNFNTATISIRRTEELIVRLFEMKADSQALSAALTHTLFPREHTPTQDMALVTARIQGNLEQSTELLREQPHQLETIQAMMNQMEDWSRFLENAKSYPAGDAYRKGNQIIYSFLEHLEQVLQAEAQAKDLRMQSYLNYRIGFLVVVLVGATGIALFLIYFSRQQLRQLSQEYESTQVGLKNTLALQRQHQDNSDFLSEATQRLGRSLNTQSILEDISQFAVPKLADWIFIDFFINHSAAQAKRLASYHRNPEKRKLLDQAAHLGPHHYWSLSREAMESGQPKILENLSEDSIKKRVGDLDTAAIFIRLGSTAAASFPLIAREKTLGCITFVLGDSGRSFNPSHLDLCAELARRTAAAVDNAMLYQSAQEAIQTRDEFLSIASHELKTPLTALSLQLQLLKREFKPQAEGSSGKPLDLCLRQVGKLSSLLDDLLDMTRIQAGRISLNKSLVDLPALVREVCGRFHLDAQAHGNTLTITGENHLTGLWDAARLEQVIANLLSNAIKYGDGKPIEIHVGRQGKKAIISVKDYGPGIEPEFQKRIFRRFERASSSTQCGGLGLGLYIAHRLCEAHQGSIKLKSRLGEGSEFIISLPLSASSEGACEPERKAC